MVRIRFKETLLSLLFIGGGSCVALYNSSLPIIDLGYVKQQATEYNQTYDFYHFRNIRYAAPPLGDLRFRKPQPPLPQTEIQNGDISFVESTCHQAWPPALGISSFGEDFGVEDCLYLDVYVPACVKPGDDVPVLTWIYGGGYITGSKEMSGDPARLIQSADEPMIYVSFNYRLGAFGWLSPSNVTGIDANVGLHDSLAAMEWVEKYISKFGGDKGKITVMGESAGGAVIMHTITSYGGEGKKLPFQQAIVQSAGFEPKRTHYDNRYAPYDEFRKSINCTTLKCLRDAPTEVLLKANHDIIVLSIGDIGTFGPAVDGDYVPDIPIRLLAQGKYHHELKSLIASNVGFEASILFPAPNNVTEGIFDTLFNVFYSLAPEALKQQALALYPYQGPGIPEWLRTSAFFSDTAVNCNQVWLARSFQNSYRYIFNVPPAFHGQDVSNTFYTGPDATIANETTATIHQKYITNYVTHGEPGCEMGACFPNYKDYEESANALSINLTEIKVVRDPWANERCDFLVDLVEYS